MSLELPPEDATTVVERSFRLHLVTGLLLVLVLVEGAYLLGAERAFAKLGPFWLFLKQCGGYMTIPLCLVSVALVLATVAGALQVFGHVPLVPAVHAWTAQILLDGPVLAQRLGMLETLIDLVLGFVSLFTGDISNADKISRIPLIVGPAFKSSIWGLGALILWDNVINPILRPEGKRA